MLDTIFKWYRDTDEISVICDDRCKDVDVSSGVTTCTNSYMHVTVCINLSNLLLTKLS